MTIFGNKMDKSPFGKEFNIIQPKLKMQFPYDPVIILQACIKELAFVYQETHTRIFVTHCLQVQVYKTGKKPKSSGYGYFGGKGSGIGLWQGGRAHELQK